MDRYWKEVLYVSTRKHGINVQYLYDMDINSPVFKFLILVSLLCKLTINLIFCRKHFINAHAFTCHIKSKPHKRRLNALKIEPYTIEESEVRGH